MGKKAKAAKIGKMVQMSKLENKTQSLEKVESQPGHTNPSPERVENQPKSVNPSLGSVELQPETISPSLVRANTRSKQQAESVKPSNPKKRMRHCIGVRRSDRIKGTVTPAQNQDIEPMIEEITLSESEKEDDDHPAQSEQNLPESETLSEKNMEEKINYIVQRLEEQETAMEALKCEVTKKSFLSGGPSRVDIRYKNLYINSQQKVESLTEENKQLAMKLETALCKVEAYQNGNHVFSDMMEKLKDVILISNLTKATETAVNFSSQALRNTSSPDDVLGSNGSAAKRKKTPVIRK